MAISNINIYLKGRNAFLSNFDNFISEINLIEKIDYEKISNMYLLINLKELLIISYDEKNGEDIFLIENSNLKLIKKFHTFNDLEKYLYSLKEIQKYLREKKIKRILNDE